MEVIVADTGKGRTTRQDERAVDTGEAARELDANTPAGTLDGALGPNWQAWQDHVKAHVQPADKDRDGYADPDIPAVPLLVYGDGPNDYIATDIDAGQVVVRDGNDRTGKAWKFPLDSFMRFVAHAHGQKVEDDDDPLRGDDPITAARKQQERTNALMQADRDAQAAAGTRRTGEGRAGR